MLILAVLLILVLVFGSNMIKETQVQRRQH
jgi:hypothetical protein